MAHPALSAIEHRPWAPPARPWGLTMDWEDLLFLHWPVEAAGLQGLLPDELEIETFDGTAWLGIVPFRMVRTRLRWSPPLPTAHRFPELNVRTYVRHRGRSGVWFFSLDAASRLAVAGARATFGLPYVLARMRSDRAGGEVRCASERVDRRAPPARFEAHYRTAGEFHAAVPGSLEHFLTERYCMFVSGRRGRILCGEIAHAPWHVAPADVELIECDMTRLLGIELSTAPSSVLAAGPQTVVGWSLRG